MASDNQSEGRQSPTRSGSASGDSPEWADGLRQLYDSVVDEPLPDSFKDLLDKLDDDNDDPGDDESSDSQSSSGQAGKA